MDRGPDEVIRRCTTGEEARLVCHEIDYGRGLECHIEFAWRHFPADSIGVFHADRSGRVLRREMDEYRLRQRVWARFWRYIGAA